MPITLLLADDSVVIQKLVGLSFANEDIEIVSVDNGDDAVSRAGECKPDIVLADVVMPGKNGYEVCAAIRSNPQLASTPVLLLTGTFEAFDEGRANEVGATGHITKPFEAQALVDRVSAILAEQRSAPPEAVPAATGGDFFDDNLDNNLDNNHGDLAQSDPASAMPAESSPPQDFAFGSSDNEPLSAPMDDVGAKTVALDTGADLGELLDGAGGDRTVAIMPDMVGADFAPVTPVAPISEQPADPTPIPTSTPAPTPTPMPTPSPDQTMLVDDLLGSADPVAEPMPPEQPTNQPGTPIGAINIDNPPAPAPTAMPSMDSPPAPPAASDASLDLDGMSFGTQPPVSPLPVPDIDAPSPDETVLAEDLFSDGLDLGPNLGDSLDSPSSPQLPPSQGLDTAFGGDDFDGSPASDSIVPENANDYDVSASDLKVDPLGESGSWSAGIPAGVQTGPEPISNPLSVSSEPAPALGSAETDSPDHLAETAGGDSGSAAVSPALETNRTVGIATPSLAPPPVESSSPETSSDLTPVMRDRIHDTLEKVAWESFSDLSDEIVRQLMQRVEQVVWEVIPQMAETLIRDEIRRMKAEEGEE